MAEASSISLSDINVRFNSNITDLITKDAVEKVTDAMISKATGLFGYAADKILGLQVATRPNPVNKVKSNELSPEEAREKKAQMKLFTDIRDALFSIRDAVGGKKGRGGGLMGYLRNLAGGRRPGLLPVPGSSLGIFDTLKQTILDNPEVSSAIAFLYRSEILKFVKDIFRRVLDAGKKVGKAAGPAGAVISIASIIYDGILGYFQDQNWNVDKVSATIGAMFGGVKGEGFINAAFSGSTWALALGIPALVFGWPAALVAGTIGAVLGSVAGYFGGEETAKVLNKLRNKPDQLLEDIGSGIIENISEFAQGVADRFNDSLRPVNDWWEKFNFEMHGLEGIGNLLKSLRDSLGILLPGTKIDENPAQQILRGIEERRNKEGNSQSDSNSKAVGSMRISSPYAAYLGSNLLNKQSERKPPQTSTVNKEATTRLQGPPPPSNPKEKELRRDLSESVNNPPFPTDNLASRSSYQTSSSPGVAALAGSKNIISDFVEGVGKFFSGNKEKDTPMTEEEFQAIASKFQNTPLFEATVQSLMTWENFPGKNYKKEAGLDGNNYTVGYGFQQIPRDMNILKSTTLPEHIPLRPVTSKDSMDQREAEVFLRYVVIQHHKELNNRYSSFYPSLPDTAKNAMINMKHQLGSFVNFPHMIRILKEYPDEDTTYGKNMVLQNAAVEVLKGGEPKDTPNRPDSIYFGQDPQRAQRNADAFIAKEIIARDNRPVRNIETHLENPNRILNFEPKPKAEGFIAKKPSVIMTGEYNGAGENPEVTIQMNALENRILATTNRLFKMKDDMLHKNPTVMNSTQENKMINTINNSRSSEERISMKESIEKQMIQVQMPVTNSVVDNKTINNTTTPVLVKKSPANENNPFRIA